MVMTNITAVLVNALAELKAAYSCKSENKKKKKKFENQRGSPLTYSRNPLKSILSMKFYWNRVIGGVT